MKALTLWQPWATLVAIGAKKIETRSWSTRYRGSLVIHAAKTNRHLRLFFEDPFWNALLDAGYTMTTLPLGCVVATCTLDSTIRITKSNASRLSEQELAFGDYTPGRFAWMLDDIVKVEPPIPARGYQGLWSIELEVAGDKANWQRGMPPADGFYHVNTFDKPVYLRRFLPENYPGENVEPGILWGWDENDDPESIELEGLTLDTIEWRRVAR